MMPRTSQPRFAAAAVRHYPWLVAIAALPWLVSSSSARAGEKPNVLFIARFTGQLNEILTR